MSRGASFHHTTRLSWDLQNVGAACSSEEEPPLGWSRIAGQGQHSLRCKPEERATGAGIHCDVNQHTAKRGVTLGLCIVEHVYDRLRRTITIAFGSVT